MGFFKDITLSLFITCLLFNCQNTTIKTKDYTKNVNNFIGTGSKGHTYPGTSVPFGMVQLSPDNGVPGCNRNSGYFYEDSTIGSFGHTHLSGTGVGDLYDIPFFPTPFSENTKPSLVKFSYENEQAKPGFYSVKLDNGIKIELTTTKRAGLHRYTFPDVDKSSVNVDLVRAINWDATVKSKIEKISNTQIHGYRYDKKIHCTIQFARN